MAKSKCEVDIKYMSTRKLAIEYENLVYEVMPLQRRVEEINKRMEEIWAELEDRGLDKKEFLKEMSFTVNHEGENN